MSGGSAEGRVLVRSEDGSLEGEMRFRSRIEEFQRLLNDAMEALDALLRGEKVLGLRERGGARCEFEAR